MEKIQAIYLGMCSYADWMLGEMLAALDEAGLADETTVVATSDHGDWAGDYGLVEKWPSALDDAITRVPLIVRTPGNEAGHVVREPVEQFDVMATILELAGVEPQHTHFARSLVPQLNGSAGDAARAVFAEGGYDTQEPHSFEGRTSEHDVTRTPGHIYWPKGLQQQEHPESASRAVMVRTMDFKLVRRTTGLNELYDLRSDPQELRNVYADSEYRAMRDGLGERLVNWYMRTSDVVPTDENPRGLPRLKG
jgi:choline-sulfatase